MKRSYIEGHQLSLGNLPAEITEQILDYVLEFPGQANADGFAGKNASEILSNPILRTSSRLRHHALNMLAQKQLWIRITSNSSLSLDWNTFRHARTSFIPEMAKVHQSMLQYQKLSVMNIIFSDSEMDETADVHLESCEYSVVFPFSSPDWFRLMDILARMPLSKTRCGPYYLALRCEATPSSIRRILDTYILPPLLHYQLPRLESLRIDGDGLNHLTDNDRLNPCCDKDFDGYVDRLRGLLCHVGLLREMGRPIDSALAMLSTNNLHRDIKYALEASRSLRTEAMFMSDHDSTKEALARSNEIQKVIADVQFQAACSMYRLYTTAGRAYLQKWQKHFDLKRNAQHWIDNLDFEWLGLRRKELARVECAKALLLFIQAEISDEYTLSAQYVPQILASAVRSAYVARKAWPDMPELQWLDNLKSKHRPVLVSRETVDPASCYVEIHRAGGSQFMWCGRAETLGLFATGPEQLMHLPKYRHRLGDKEDAEEQYCGLACECIVY